MSSANKIGKRASVIIDKVFIYDIKRSALSILPCGTPQVTVSVLDLEV